ncbi:hypothetical protein BU17DRAFT_78073 [Hysterangium stoloniferum]|nr:hypothetical protein BU17DRAFT_78073 [Hysterangium stoloniferum]
MTTTSQHAVARVTSLASDLILDALPRAPNKSVFQHGFHRTFGILSIRHGVDIGSAILSKSDAELISDILSSFIPHLAEISSRPVVLHVAVDDDLSSVLSLQSTLPFVLYSASAQQAHDHALLASRLARLERKAVLHIFHTSKFPEDVSEVDATKVGPFLSAERRQSRTTSILTGTNADSPLFDAFESASLDTLSLVRRALPPLTYSGPSRPSTLICTLSQTSIDDNQLSHLDAVGALQISLLSPLPSSTIRGRIPSSVSRIFVLEQIRQWPTKYTPLFLDIVTAMQVRSPRPTVQAGTIGPHFELQRIVNTGVSEPIHIGPGFPTPGPQTTHVEVPSHESTYTKILADLFGERLRVENAPNQLPHYGDVATRPEFALGRAHVQVEGREELVHAVKDVLRPDASLSLPQDLTVLLGKWLIAKDDGTQSRVLADQIIPLLESIPALSHILSLRTHFSFPSRWIIGSDAWSYDLGASGFHHHLSSNLNVNLLLLDTIPYTRRDSFPEARLKKDAGLYAMNRGNVYVASVAVYSSYGQVLQALVEADKYPGPSVVLAYLPYELPDNVDAGALQVLKETKLAVDAGYWPLYRWDPAKERDGKDPFSLDSEAIKADLQQFLDRQNHLSQLVRSSPSFASELVGGLGETLKEARKKKAQQAYDDLLNSMDGLPLLVLYASDSGTAEKIAKRLAMRGRARGLATRVQSFDSFAFADLAQESHVAFITSTSGQGEPPQNGRDMFKAINAAVSRKERPLTSLKYSVFGLGDSHYWPRPEDKHYYNRPGKDLDGRLSAIGAERFADLGLGDDQDADGPQTGYKDWESMLWKGLGVDTVEVSEAEPEVITNEHIKVASNFLRGTIKESLEDTSTGGLAPSDCQVTKFHGFYQQDDRDIRDERKDQGLEPAYGFMIRVRLAAGVCTPEQWLVMDRIADERGNGTFKLTTRQTFQFHGILKHHVKPSIQAINRALLDTIAACGDVNRNILCPSMPPLKHLHAEMYAFAHQLSERLLPRTTAYHEIWLDKKLVAGDAVKDFEPIYGEAYLPRKFKMAIACPPHNDVDVFTNDVGFIAIADKQERLTGFNVIAGGGMGVTHGNKKTYPRLGDLLGFVTVEQAYVMAECILTIQRDNGNRQDRKIARLKHTIDRMGLDVFIAEAEKRAGFCFEPARPFSFDSNIDVFGWTDGLNDTKHYTCFIENGRVQDEPGRHFKAGLREIAQVHKGTFRLTSNQHLIIAEIPNDQVPVIEKLLSKYKLDSVSHSGLRLASSACVAFPTCGLAMAESERYLPFLIDKVERICEEVGLRNDSIVMRMSGCPNGCSRPYVAEVAFVGKSPGVYVMLLGGGYYGQRLNRIYRESVTEPEILAILRPMIKRYALERLEGERFGDFTIRAGYVAPAISGKGWYD